MAVKKISEYPEAVLAQVGKPVTEFDDALAELCADMYDTMYDAEGVGLAAPQIGLNLRLFVMDCSGGDDPSEKIAVQPPAIVAVAKASAHVAGRRRGNDIRMAIRRLFRSVRAGLR